MKNFTPRAQQALAFARKEADRLHHNYVGTEHVLLGLISLGQGVAVNVLGKMGLDLDTVRMEVEKQVGSGQEIKMAGNIPYTPRVKKVLALASKEARALNHSYVGTEHLLLGLLREGEGVAAHVLNCLDVDTEKARLEILKELDPDFSPADMEADHSEMPEKKWHKCPACKAMLHEIELADNLRVCPKCGLQFKRHAEVVRKPPCDSVDTSKRYDVYCIERDQQVVVYRNALFKGRRKLLHTGQHDFRAEFLELEQSSGQTVYLSLRSVLKFCEHGAELAGEIIPPE